MSTTLNCNGQLISLNTPKIMGILNVTPDSFYDGGKYKDEKGILTQVEKMLKEGATFIDVGAYSSRPGAAEITEETELSRILPIVQIILRQFPNTILSIDTFRSNVAKACINEGAAIINDISGGLRDKMMIKCVANLSVPYIIMHMRGTPKTMHTLTQYDDLLKQILLYFSERISVAKAEGIKDIIIDPGFGFSKTLEQNYKLLHNANIFKQIAHPMLIGISRKSMIYKLFNTDANHALNATTALNMVSLHKGAQVLRVHDVKEAMECVQLYKQLIA